MAGFEVFPGSRLRVLCLTSAVLLTCSAWSKETTSEGSGRRRQDIFPPGSSALEYFNVTDALALRWYHGANSIEQMEEALNGDYQLIEGDITLEWFEWPNETTLPIMAHPPDVTSDNTLDNWLTNIFSRDDKSPKLDMKIDEVIEHAMAVLATKRGQVNHPIQAHADVVHGPGAIISFPKDFDNFMTQVNRYWPDLTLSLGWTTGCCFELFTREMMEEMYDLVKDLPHNVTFSARASLFKDSWPHFKWLIQQDPSRFSITVWIGAGQVDWEGATPYDMLYVRNDCPKSWIYYDLVGPQFDAFRQLAITAGSVFNHFDGQERDGLLITWAHAVNSQAELDAALADDDIQMLEADVLVRWQGYPNQTNVPIMAHPPAVDSDITLEEWLERVVNTNKGIKLDFKSIEAVKPSMELLQEVRGRLQQPVWANADIFTGPGVVINGTDTSNPVNASEFRRMVLDIFPECTLSPGWTTRWSNNPDVDEVYTEAMVVEMTEYAEDLDQPITLPLRAAMLGQSWHLFEKFLNESRAYTVTVWSGRSDEVDVDDLVYVRQNSEIDRVYYDLPDELRDEFMRRLNMTLPI